MLFIPILKRVSIKDLTKLRAYGISSTLIRWIEDFLNDRKHRIRVNNSFSEWGQVSSGIPQGRFLGPILFLLYMYIYI
jgi:hypothetical protein